MNNQGKKIPEKTWNELLVLISENFGILSVACKAVGINRRSYYNKLLQDPVFAQRAQIIFERIQVPIAEEMLRAAVIERNPWAIRFTLEKASPKWHSKIGQSYIRDFEERLFYIEDQLMKKRKAKSTKTNEKLPKAEESPDSDGGETETPAF